MNRPDQEMIMCLDPTFVDFVKHSSPVQLVKIFMAELLKIEKDQVRLHAFCMLLDTIRGLGLGSVSDAAIAMVEQVALDYLAAFD